MHACHNTSDEAADWMHGRVVSLQVTASLCRALHDLVLLQLLWDSGVPAGQALRPAADVWRDVEQEGLSGVPVEGEMYKGRPGILVCVTANTALVAAMVQLSRTPWFAVASWM